MTSSKRKTTAAYISVLIGNSIFGFSFMFSRIALNAARPFVMLMCRFIIAFLGMSVLALFDTRMDPDALFAPLKEPSFLGALLYLSLLSSIGAYLLVNYASTELPVGRVTTFCSLTTVLSVFAGVVFPGETINFVSLIAAAVIITGVFFVQRS